jgi:sortase A
LRRNGVTMMLVLALLAGIGLLLYPSVSNWWNQVHQSNVVVEYASAVSNMDEKQYKKILGEARDYNKRLSETGAIWNMTAAQRDEYNSILNVDGHGAMGYIHIPKINVELPIYHGTDDSVLQSSIGHLAGTSLPVGGKGTHTVLSGHRGLPSAMLFTDLDRLKEGDTFTITVLNKTLTYEVDQIRIVEPTDLSSLQIEKGKDLCTLVTCTPYGINTHRLLVRGHRIPNANGDAQVIAEALQVPPAYIALAVVIVVLLVLIAYSFVRMRSRRKASDFQASYLAEQGLQRPNVDMHDEEAQGFLQRLRNYLQGR